MECNGPPCIHCVYNYVSGLRAGLFVWHLEAAACEPAPLCTSIVELRDVHVSTNLNENLEL